MTRYLILINNKIIWREWFQSCVQTFYAESNLKINLKIYLIFMLKYWNLYLGHKMILVFMVLVNKQIFIIMMSFSIKVMVEKINVILIYFTLLIKDFEILIILEVIREIFLVIDMLNCIFDESLKFVHLIIFLLILVPFFLLNNYWLLIWLINYII